MSPSLIAFAVVNGAQASKVPPVEAVKIPAQPIVPQFPPEAAANSIAAALVNVVAVPLPEMVPVTTPGYGEAEATAAALELAKKDPLYAEFQTANVFGSALEKALGVRP